MGRGGPWYSMFQLFLSLIQRWTRRGIRPAGPAAAPPASPPSLRVRMTNAAGFYMNVVAGCFSSLSKAFAASLHGLVELLFMLDPLLYDPLPRRGGPRMLYHTPKRRAGALFVGLPDVLQGLIASWLPPRDLLELCACSPCFDGMYAPRVTRLRLGGRRNYPRSLEETEKWLEELRGVPPPQEDAEAEERGADSSRDAQLSKSTQVVTRLLSRLPGLRELVLGDEQAVRAVVAGLRATSGGTDRRGVVMLERLEHLDFACQPDSTSDLLLALHVSQGSGGRACVSPGLRHLLLRRDGRMAGDDDSTSRGCTDVLKTLMYSLITREQMGAASLLTLRLYVWSPRDGDVANSGRLLSRLLLTSKACESLEKLIIDGSLRGECLQAVEVYLSSHRAARLRRLRCSWSILGGRTTIIPSTLAGGMHPLLEHVDMSTSHLHVSERDQLVQWANSPLAARLVGLRLGLPAGDLPVVLSAAVESHGLPRLRTLRLDGHHDFDAAVVALVGGMESGDALACLERLEAPQVGDEGIRRLAAYLTEDRGCSRTLRQLKLRYSRATDEAGAQLGRTIQAGGLTALEELILDENKAWGDATMCALVEALESGKGKSLKEVRMHYTGLGSVGYQRIIQAVKGGLDKRPTISFYGCDVPELRANPYCGHMIFAKDTLALIKMCGHRAARP